MQKLSVELKNVPRDAPQVLCSTRPWLNRDKSLSAMDKVLADNNLDVDLPVWPFRDKRRKALLIGKTATKRKEELPKFA